ncbi:unnamed protein product [Polarella glacialis]|uniref:Uncharacterized protein n=1 Tax=Polarella glacialis TaxID=89957 RepID=A0A813EAR4_POLGL|nr:unnamed protein product [Polarella glacialis]
MAAMHFLELSLLSTLLLRASGSFAEDRVPHEWDLLSDDECMQSGTTDCSFSARQLRSQIARQPGESVAANGDVGLYLDAGKSHCSQWDGYADIVTLTDCVAAARSMWNPEVCMQSAAGPGVNAGGHYDWEEEVVLVHDGPQGCYKRIGLAANGVHRCSLALNTSPNGSILPDGSHGHCQAEGEHCAFACRKLA